MGDIFLVFAYKMATIMINIATPHKPIVGLLISGYQKKNVSANLNVKMD